MQKCSTCSKRSWPFYRVFSSGFFKSHIAHPGGSVSYTVQSGWRAAADGGAMLAVCPVNWVFPVVRQPVSPQLIYMEASHWLLVRQHAKYTARFQPVQPETCVETAPPRGCNSTTCDQLVAFRPVIVRLWHSVSSQKRSAGVRSFG